MPFAGNPNQIRAYMCEKRNSAPIPTTTLPIVHYKQCSYLYKEFQALGLIEISL